jgi:hypothetical protein
MEDNDYGDIDREGILNKMAYILDRDNSEKKDIFD